MRINIEFDPENSADLAALAMLNAAFNGQTQQVNVKPDLTVAADKKKDEAAPKSGKTAPELIKEVANGKTAKEMQEELAEEGKAVPEVTLDAVKELASSKMADHADSVVAKIRSYGVKKLSEIPEAVYGEFYACLEGLK